MFNIENATFSKLINFLLTAAKLAMVTENISSSVNVFFILFHLIFSQ